MPEAKEQKMQLTESQLMQMAQQEEYELRNKQALLERVGALFSEAITAKETLKELKNAKGKMQISIGATVLVEVNAENVKTCKRGFSENAYKEEGIDETIEWLSKKEEKIKKQLEALQKEAGLSSTRLTEIVGILKQIEQEKRKVANRAPPTISK